MKRRHAITVAKAEALIIEYAKRANREHEAGNHAEANVWATCADDLRWAIGAK